MQQLEKAMAKIVNRVVLLRFVSALPNRHDGQVANGRRRVRRNMPSRSCVPPITSLL
jgi:hypothetical protein